MRVIMDRNMCGAWSPACEECFGVFLAHGKEADRACITEVIDDGSDTLNAVIRSGHFVGTLVVRPEEREAVIREGWRKFATLPDEAFDILPPHAEDIRAANRQD